MLGDQALRTHVASNDDDIGWQRHMFPLNERSHPSTSPLADAVSCAVEYEEVRIVFHVDNAYHTTCIMTQKSAKTRVHNGASILAPIDRAAGAAQLSR